MKQHDLCDPTCLRESFLRLCCIYLHFERLVCPKYNTTDKLNFQKYLVRAREYRIIMSSIANRHADAIASYPKMKVRML